MNTLVSSACLLFLLPGATGPARAADGSTDAPRMDDFTLIEESRPHASSARAAPSQLRRIYRLGTGETVELVHTELASGMLELDASQQSPSTLDALDRYCARIGGTVSRDSVSVFSPQTHTLLSCVGTAPRPGKPDQTRAETVTPSAKRNSCGAASSIVMDGPGSVYRGILADMPFTPTRSLKLSAVRSCHGWPVSSRVAMSANRFPLTNGCGSHAGWSALPGGCLPESTKETQHCRCAAILTRAPLPLRSGHFMAAESRFQATPAHAVTTRSPAPAVAQQPHACAPEPRYWQ